jgi:hypothetical protein
MIRVDFFQVDSARSIAPFALGRNSKGNRCVGHRRPFQLISVELSRLITGTANAGARVAGRVFLGSPLTKDVAAHWTRPDDEAVSFAHPFDSLSPTPDTRWRRGVHIFRVRHGGPTESKSHASIH